MRITSYIAKNVYVFPHRFFFLKISFTFFEKKVYADFYLTKLTEKSATTTKGQNAHFRGQKSHLLTFSKNA